MSSAAVVAQSIAAGRIISTVVKHVSHVGKRAIPLPAGVTVVREEPGPGSSAPTKSIITVTGPRGSTSLPIDRFVRLDQQTQPGRLLVTVKDPSRRAQREIWGLSRTLVSNAITGMSDGFTTPVHLVGVGFRAAIERDPQGKYPNAIRLHMKLGYSHSVYVPVPAHIKVECPFPTRIMVTCNDKQKLGQFCADIRRWRKPEPYKGKGVFVGNEVVRIKSVKKK